MHKNNRVALSRPAAAVAVLIALLAASPVPAEDAAGPAAADAAALPEALPAALTERRTAAQERLLRLLDEGRPEEAVTAGLEVVELTRQLKGDDSVELAAPLTNLATAQLRSGDLLAAESNYTAAVAVVERREGIISPRLINPLLGLGETYIRGEQYVQATEAYERALRVNHVNDGFYNFEQFPIRDGLTESYLGQQKLDKANFHQEAQVAVQQRKLGKENPELVPALSKLGRWYERSNQAEAARLVYQKTAQLVEQAEGENDPAMVEPLIAIADSYRQQALLPADPESSQAPETLLPMSGLMLRKALGIIDQQQPPDPLQRARVLVKLGDLYMLWGKQNTATDRYTEAWQQLSTDERYAGERDGYFAQPAKLLGPEAPLIFPTPSRKKPPPRAKDLEPGYVIVRYTVDPTGRVTEAKVVESDPAGLLDGRVTDAVRRSLYRPRYAEGVAVLANGLTLRHEFRYSPLPPSQKSTPPAGSDKPLEQPKSAQAPGDVPIAGEPAAPPLAPPAASAN